MKSELHSRLLRRELGGGKPYSSIGGIYGDKAWVDDLDIVNELGGHTGCVNALCWSNSGKLLASGSDDQHLNIYSYQPDDSTVPFFLNTTVATGHTANIFSVKFVPHSNDRTLVSCAGDSEVRVFDIEYSGRTSDSGPMGASGRRLTNFFNGMSYLTDANTNARVYRSHSDRVKRIVTESSPYLFLTCSEDGEVRQWDLRQPSSAYPSPRGGQGFMAYRRRGVNHDDSNVPPPLISYKPYNVDLNSISCSGSQPHYIALGGDHLHCFLHDRRMLGRDFLAERGQVGSPSPVPGTADDGSMAKATQCVRRFAPNGRKKAKPRESGHITACKISDANPNEMVVSWSGDHIYSFDLIRNSDARDAQDEDKETAQQGTGSGRAKKSKMRKRKRERAASLGSRASGNRHQSQLRSEGSPGSRDASFRVRYGNGRSEDIPLESLSQGPSDTAGDVMERARESVLNEAQKLSMRIAKGLVEIRRLMFSIDTSVREDSSPPSATDPTPYTASFTSALGCAATYLPQMDEVIRTWRYPLNPSMDDVLFQQALRRNRETTRRFVQASGTLARVLGGRIQTASSADSPQLQMFRQIVPAPTENGLIDPETQFGYDFLKAILLWLEGGRRAVVDGFRWTHARRHDAGRFPIPESAGDSAIEEHLIPYLEQLAGESQIVNVDANRFEYDESRVLFPTQVAAVKSFSVAIGKPLEDLSDTAADFDYAGDGPNIRALDRRAAINFWALKVGRGILMELGDGINFEFVNRAFGGIRAVVSEEDDEDNGEEMERMQEDIDPNEEEEQISGLQLIQHPQHEGSRRRQATVESATEGEAESLALGSLLQDDGAQSNASDEDFNPDLDENESDDDDAHNDSDEDDEDEDDSDSSDSEHEGHLRRHLFFRRGPRKRAVETHVPCFSHMNVYKGHCNVRTVKDVSYFGLDDQYVVSGSDCGHVFIWDRKTSNLVNILRGDDDTVNVVQGHPYEPTLAVSGIDETVKIFSPDARAQHNARLGVNIANPDARANVVSGAPLGSNQPEQRGLGLESRKKMQDSYQIMSQNDVNRQGGLDEAFVTRSMLARLATALREGRATGGHGNHDGFGEGEHGATIVLDENCSVM